MQRHYDSSKILQELGAHFNATKFGPEAHSQVDKCQIFIRTKPWKNSLCPLLDKICDSCETLILSWKLNSGSCKSNWLSSTTWATTSNFKDCRNFAPHVHEACTGQVHGERNWETFMQNVLVMTPDNFVQHRLGQLIVAQVVSASWFFWNPNLTIDIIELRVSRITSSTGTFLNWICQEQHAACFLLPHWADVKFKIRTSRNLWDFMYSFHCFFINQDQLKKSTAENTLLCKFSKATYASCTFCENHLNRSFYAVFTSNNFTNAE